MKSSLKGALIAVAVGGLFAANATLAADESKDSKIIKSEEDNVKCSGINSCKGQGSCAAAGHECAGKNGCKGQGWVKVGSARACTDKGGRIDEN